MKASANKTPAKREAPQYLTQILYQMEALVLSTKAAYLRAYTWLRLVTV